MGNFRIFSQGFFLVFLSFFWFFLVLLLPSKTIRNEAIHKAIGTFNQKRPQMKVFNAMHLEK